MILRRKEGTLLKKFVVGLNLYYWDYFRHMMPFGQSMQQITTFVEGHPWFCVD